MFQNINYDLVSTFSHKEMACSTVLITSVKSIWKGSINFSISVAYKPFVDSIQTLLVLVSQVILNLLTSLQ